MQKQKVKSEKKRITPIAAVADLIAPNGGLSVEMKGRSNVTVRGCRKIAVYKPTLISLALFDGFINICGKELTCFAYSGRDITVTGKIKCIFFSEKAPEGGKQ